ncbi:TetR-like C-terminal domain-containing protein [Coprobacillaceae bacterium CR2/5/TPMF4]|nr:TetR-like C-terminal domain-containing protein [Coprobacillaceae bacterium CR2/5/TPMF4]
MYEFYKGIIEKNLNHSVDDDLDFLLKMYCKGSIDMTVDWVLNDMPISIEKIVSLLIELCQND